MKFVRIDSLAPGATPLELHAQLTLLRGASPELRRRLLAAARAVVGSGELAETGVLEVSGVQLALDRSTVEQLRIDAAVDPVLAFGSRATPASGTSVELPPPVVVLSDDEVALRAQLRQVTTARTELGARMESARAGLDSFSNASLEVCRGQIEALELRRAALRADWEHERAERAEQADAASVQLHALRSLIDSIEAAVATGPRLAAARAAVDEVSGIVESDASALALADELEASIGQVAAFAARADRRRAELAARRDALEVARTELAEVQAAPRVDRDVVERLEAIREEIFSADERPGVLGAARQKRRLAELRSEEAILLDRLGFDTYSAYVMGIPTLRAEMERSSRTEEVAQRVVQLEAELAAAEGAIDLDPDARRVADELHRCAYRALELLASDDPLPAPIELARIVADAEVADSPLGHALEGLRRRSVPDPAVVAARRDELDAALAELDRSGREVRAAAADLPDEPVALVTPPEVPETADATAWEGWLESAGAWSAGATGAVSELIELQSELGDEGDAQRIARWAEVEAELDEALDRLTAAQERVRLHEEATAQLAELRTEELALRDQERELLARIGELEAMPVPPPVPPAPEPSGSDPSVPIEAEVDHEDPDAVEWALVARLARQRSVSFVGSVPIVVDGLPVAPAVRQRVLERLGRMSDLVQVIVLADEDAAAEWVGQLGEQARRIEL